MPVLDKFSKTFRLSNELSKEMLAEFYGTFILVSFAVAASAQYVFTDLSSYLTVNFANGMGLVLAIYAAGGVSGASLNPAASIALCLHGFIPWYKYPFYTIAEIAGAFAASAVQYGINYDMLNAYDGGNRTTYGPTATAAVFSTFPNPEVSNLNCFFDQVFGTFVLVICIFAILDSRNSMPIDKGLIPLSMGGIVFAIGTCWAGNCGYAINPARDLGPRLFTAVAGWGLEPFSYRNYGWFWIPIVGPMVGATIGYFVYQLCIEIHWTPEPESTDVVVSANGTKEKPTELTGVDNIAFISSKGRISEILRSDI
ncbi:aquaporin-9 isoform X1 [Patella vulgata]|uniref:aquaporin-9 isoform X1 n=1 Tax=Patella vulgata TaxID=6465 RepID=UPI0021801D02|nr:aquaporin-9 isoform X1 [Patella vulgata]